MACVEKKGKVENKIECRIGYKKYVKSSVKKEGDCKYARKESRYRKDV